MADNGAYASEFIQQQVQRLLAQAAEALNRLDWDEVRARAEALLALDPDNSDGRRLIEATDRALGRESSPPTAARPSQAHADPTSFVSGRDQVVRLLGEGATKRVYLAHDTKLDRDVAFALVKTEGLDAEGLTRIRREAQAMARLGDHPNIVAVHDIGDEAHQPYIVSQYMAGGDLQRLIEQAPERRVPLDQATKIAEQVCQALEHAHAHGVIHRDLKPGNVWLTEGVWGSGFGVW